MTDPYLYSRRTVRRLRLLAVTFIVGYAVSAASFYPFCSHLSQVIGYYAPFALAAGGAFLTAGGLTAVAHFVHKSFWPERPGEA